MFVFDANTILNLYRFSPEARREFLKLLADQKNRIWMPHQAVKEFFRNRLGEIGAQSEHYQQASSKINDIEGMLSRDRRHPYIEDALMKKLSDVFVAVNAELLRNKDSLLTMLSDDPILNELGELFKDRVGRATERPELEAIFADGAIRFKDKIPPGFADGKKRTSLENMSDHEAVYGDLILWTEVIAESNLKQKPVIFITDDRKEDWWLEQNGKTIGPRPELLEEFLNKTGQNFYMYRPQQFLLYSKDKLGSTVSDNTIREVKELDNAKDYSNRERDIFVRAALRHSRMPSFEFLKSLQNNVDNELN